MYDPWLAADGSAHHAVYGFVHGFIMPALGGEDGFMAESTVCTITTVDGPLQSDTDNCGVFVLMWFRYEIGAEKGKLPADLTSAQLAHLRHHILYRHVRQFVSAAITKQVRT